MRVIVIHHVAHALQYVASSFQGYYLDVFRQPQHLGLVTIYRLCDI